MNILQYMALIGSVLIQMVTGQPQITAIQKTEKETEKMAIQEEKAEPEKPKPVEKSKIKVTGYSSTPDQTDDTPFITASGKTVKDGIIASNFLPFGTKVKLPEAYGDKIFVVEDRMAKRFDNHIDIWFDSRTKAIEFGVKTLEMEMVD